MMLMFTILSITILVIIILTILILNKRRKCFSIKMTNEEKKCYIELIKNVSNILEKHNIKWIPVAGNLLALYRHDNIFIPWDDDFDFVVDDRNKKNIINILKKELPLIGIEISFQKKWGKNGHLYKIYFNKNNKMFQHIIRKFPFVKFNWPFVDLFLNCDNTENKNLLDNLYNLQKNEFPLKCKKTDGINICTPTNGNRTYKSFKDNNYFKECKEASLFEGHMSLINVCKGKKTIPCHELNL